MVEGDVLNGVASRVCGRGLEAPRGSGEPPHKTGAPPYNKAGDMIAGDGRELTVVEVSYKP